MSYERQTFTDFDEDNPLSAANMTHIEDGIVSAHEGLDSKVPLPATATVGTYLKVTEVDDRGRITKVETVALSGDGAELPTNMVTCDLEGATEDESTVPVNADTLGGNLPVSFVRYGDAVYWEFNVAEELGANVVQIKVGRSGNVTTVSFYGTGITLPSDGKLILKNIASYGGVPIFSVNAATYLWDAAESSDAKVSAFLFLSTAGNLCLYSAGPPAYYNLVRGNLTYMTADPMPTESIEEVAE